MKKVTTLTKLAAILLLFMVTGIKAQTSGNRLPFNVNHVFDVDSLQGFDEELAKRSAFADEFFGDEFKVYMYRAKRNYINAKYNIRVQTYNVFKGTDPNVTVAGCVNEDFEASAVGPVTTTGGVAGWTCSGGNNGYVSGSSCSLAGCCPSAPTAMAVFSNGYIDGTIGAGYPIYSVFGSPTTNTGNSIALNAPLGAMYGSKFIRINDNTPNCSMNKLSKTFAVTSANALFQFAFISVFYTGHPCCDAGAFQIKLTNATAGTVIACPSFSYSAPSSACTTTAPSNVTYYNAGTTNTATTASSLIYNPWKLASIDLTAYIGSNITIDIISVDCTGGAHYNEVYFDAQCGPMAIIGNGTSFPAGTPNITLPTCGAGSTATITAPTGLGPYQWTGPAGFVPSTLQTITTNISGNYTLTMNPAGSCTPTIKTVSVVISPAPNVAVSSQTQVSCTSTANAVALVMGSGTPNLTITPNYSVSFSPSSPVLVGSSANTATYSTLSAGINTVTVTDAVGCINTATFNVLAAVPVPSFSISAPSGTVLGCSPPTLPLNAVNTGTASPLSYTWTSISTGTATGASISGSAPTGTNTYIVSAQAPGSCLVTQTITIMASTAVPGITVTPTTRTITCNGAPACFTAICSPTTNVQGQWFDATATALGGLSNSPILMCTGVPGTYSVVVTNITNGCVAIQTVAVSANTIVPTMTVNSLQGNTITCNQPCLVFNITASPGPAPKSYSWTNVTTSVTTTPATGGYTICTPGNYVAQYQDGNLCRISQTITVMIDTLRPTPLSMTDLPSNSYTLSCYNPTLVATGYSNPLLPATNYSWTIPPNLTISTNTISISTVSVTSNPTTFTVLAKGANGCVGRQKVNFYEDLIVPPYTAVFTPSAITCTQPFVAMSPNSTSTSTIPVTFTFTSPPPTTTATASGSLFGIVGTYTMTYQNTVNGCIATTNTTVPTNVTPPSTVAIAPVNIPCGTTTVGINAGTTAQLSTYTYTWFPPSGAGLSCAACYSTSVNMPGTYEVVITNTVNGCTAANEVVVGSGSLSVGFTPTPSEGFAPLSVNFTNNTALGATSGTGSITTTWSYGNGTSYSVTNSNVGGTPNGATIYQSAGNYTVLLVVQQSIYTGTTITANCVGTATGVVTVELPSEIIVPNIFTPNGDGANDVFTIQNTNLTNVTCQIFDRWGVKMYDVTSEKGQIGWDGKNLGGKEVPSGTYFYMLKATGKDGVPYDKKGTVSLYR